MIILVSVKGAVLSCPDFPSGMMIFFPSCWEYSGQRTLPIGPFQRLPLLKRPTLPEPPWPFLGHRCARLLYMGVEEPDTTALLRTTLKSHSCFRAPVVICGHHWGYVAAWVLLLSSSASFPSANYPRPPPERTSSILNSESASQRTQPVILTNHTFRHHMFLF